MPLTSHEVSLPTSLSAKFPSTYLHQRDPRKPFTPLLMLGHPNPTARDGTDERTEQNQGSSYPRAPISAALSNF